MKNGGFTLIELLAVVVVLGAIALITVPVVTNSIKKSQASAELRGMQLYAKSISQSIMDRQVNEDFSIEDGCYEINENGNLCLDESCTNILEVSAKSKPKNGTVCMANKRISTISTNDKQYGYDETNTLVLISE